MSRLQQLIYVTVSSLTFISNASMAPGIGMFLFVGPTTEKSFFLFFFDFETIASFTHVLYQYDNGAAQLVFRNLLSVHELKRTHGDH